MPVCIAGMHRSGTSMFARLCHLGGLYLGEEGDFLPPTEENPEGYWENTRFYQLNEQILEELGGSWQHPPFLSSEWLNGKACLSFQGRAADLLQDFQEREPWGWKDPRNSLTLPFWASVIPDLKVIVCLRSPVEVALSLSGRGLCCAQGLNLWLAYNQTVIEATTPEQRLITHYDAFFEDPDREIRRALEFIGIPATEEVIERCRSAISPGQRRHRSTPQQVQDAHLSPRIRCLYLQMCAEADRPVEGEDRSAGGSWAADGFWQELQSLRAETAVQQAEIRRGQAALAAKEEEAQAAAREAAQSQSAIQRLREEGEALRQRTSRFRQERDALREVLAAQADELDVLATRMASALGGEGEPPDWAAVLADEIIDQRLIQRIRIVAANILPPGAGVLVVSRGDDRLLTLCGQRAMYFPQTEEGDYTGYYPGESAELIDHLEALRVEKAAGYLLFPRTAYWWLGHYAEFCRHLDDRYDRIWCDENCILYRLDLIDPIERTQMSPRVWG